MEKDWIPTIKITPTIIIKAHLKVRANRSARNIATALVHSCHLPSTASVPGISFALNAWSTTTQIARKEVMCVIFPQGQTK